MSCATRNSSTSTAAEALQRPRGGREETEPAGAGREARLTPGTGDSDPRAEEELRCLTHRALFCAPARRIPENPVLGQNSQDHRSLFGNRASFADISSPAMRGMLCTMRRQLTHSDTVRGNSFLKYPIWCDSLKLLFDAIAKCREACGSK